MNPFDYIKEITVGKKNLIVDDETEKGYIPFIVNRGISYHRDCILQSNEMNMRPSISRKMQNDFFLNIIRSYRRPYIKWTKPEISNDLEYVKLYFGFSGTKAMEALRILSKEDLSFIKKETDKGGVRN